MSSFASCATSHTHTHTHTQVRDGSIDGHSEFNSHALLYLREDLHVRQEREVGGSNGLLLRWKAHETPIRRL